MARSRAPGIDRRQRLSMLRGQWLDCAFRRFASLLLLGANFFWNGVVVVGIARTQKCAARTSLFCPPPRRSAGEGDHAKHGGGGMRRFGNV